jgi:hypothetical protein
LKNGSKNALAYFNASIVVVNVHRLYINSRSQPYDRELCTTPVHNVKIYSAKNSLVRFENQNCFLLLLKNALAYFNVSVAVVIAVVGLTPGANPTIYF